MSKALHAVLEDAMTLKGTVRSARERGELPPAEAEQALSATARIIQIVADVNTGKVRGSVQIIGPLPEFMTWPSRSMPCPKCGESDPGRRTWYGETKDAPERVRHECRCTFYLFTKPLDATEEPPL